MKSLPVFKISFADIQGWDRVNFAGPPDLKGLSSQILNDMIVVPLDRPCLGRSTVSFLKKLHGSFQPSNPGGHEEMSSILADQ
jgi:hypothetical protein